MSEGFILELSPNEPEIELKVGLQFFSTIYSGKDFELAKIMYNGFKIMIEEESVLPFPGTEFHVRVLKVDVETTYAKPVHTIFDAEIVLRIKGEIV